MKIAKKGIKILSVLLVLVICLTILPQNVYAAEGDWEAIQDTFTLEAVKRFFPDTGLFIPDDDNTEDPNPNDGFAVGVYNAISDAIQYDEYHIDKENILDPEGYNALFPEPLTIEEIIESGVTGDDLVKAILENYCGPINAQRLKIRDITGFQYLKNTTSIDFEYNLIEDLSGFNGDYVIAGSYNFNANPIHIWPVHFPNTARSSTHSVPTMFTISTAPLHYWFGEEVTPSVTYGVYYPNPETVNTAWYFKSWSETSAYATPPSETLTTNGLGGITLPTLQKEGNAIIEIGLTGLKQGETEEEVKADQGNAISYSSGMGITPEAQGGGLGIGTPGQGNSPSYRFGVQVQRYAKLTLEDESVIKGGFQFIKKSASSDESLANAEYTLYEDAQCQTPMLDENDELCTYTTDADGIIKAVGFEPGTYYLKETKAPVGYALDTTVFPVVINDPGKPVTVTGGLSSFEHDVTDPVLNAVWGTKTATSGEWSKLVEPTTVSKDDNDVQALTLLTNKGNGSYKKLSALSAEPVKPTGATEKQYTDKTTIEVYMGGELYGTYTSDQENETNTAAKQAMDAINSIINAKNLTGNIHIVQTGEFEAKEAVYTNVGEIDEESGMGVIKDKPLPVNLGFTPVKNISGGFLTDHQFKFLLKQTGTPGDDTETIEDDVAYLIPEGTSVVGYNTAEGEKPTQGVINFIDENLKNYLVFSEPGTYTFELSEDIAYRNAELLEENPNAYDGIEYDVVYDDEGKIVEDDEGNVQHGGVRDITVVVTWEGDSCKATVSVVPRYEGAEPLTFGPYYGFSNEGGATSTNSVSETGAVTAEPVSVTSTDFKFDNEKDYSLKITKNNKNADPLKDAGFKVYTDVACTALAEVYSDSEKTTLIKDTADSVLRTDASGVLHFYGLTSDNTYYVKEVYTPMGYSLLEEPIKITIDNKGVVMVNDEFDKTPGLGGNEIALTVSDVLLDLDMPTTGFGGSIPFVAAGGSLILAAFSGFIILNKRRTKRR